MQQSAETFLPGLSIPSVLFVATLVLFVAVLAVKFKFPTPWIIGPLITSAVLTVTGYTVPHLPQPFVIAAQCSLGIYLGLGIKLNTLSNWRRLLPYSFAAGLAIVAFAFAISYGMSLIYPISLVTAFLSVAPGGLPEMGVTAHTVNADVSIVTAYQLFRVFFILFIVPLALRRVFGGEDQSFSQSSKRVGDNVR
ncbi:AbrB family transcriptional regulator [Bacillus songklensis]|uniref:AbrB family transcriptional regulator n=1 Tax=Bacillus songklensis TaxID=1069116 RepID=A0ABV8B770_9BACI